jgi:hypothetical protein
MFSVEIDFSEYDDAKRETIKEIDRLRYKVVGQASQEAVRAAKSGGRFKNQTGHLRGTISRISQRVIGRTVWGGFEAQAKYASFVEFGTKPHDILPLNYCVKRGRPISRITGKRVSVPHGVGRGHALRFYIGGRAIFARRVRHPGTRPDPFMQPATILATWRLQQLTHDGLATLQSKFWR